MAVNRNNRNLSYGLGEPLLDNAPLPIISQRAPTTSDMASIGTLWVDQPNDDTYILTSIVANSSSWINAGGGTGTFNSLTVTTTGSFGTSLTVGTTLTVSGLGRGVVQSSAAGLFSSSEGTDGQLLIGSSAGAPAWAAITPGAGINITNAGNSITVTATGAVASTFPTDSGTATPAAGATTIAGGSNINTAGAGSTVTVNLDNSIALAGSVTAGIDLSMLAGDMSILATTDAAQTIYLHANGGTNETIDIHSDQGTGVSAIDIHADVGGIDIDSGLSTADAINIVASDAAGGIDIDSGTSGTTIDSTGAISIDGAAASNFSVTGALNDLTLASAAGSLNITAGEAAADAIVIDATNAGGGIDVDAGTGGMSFVTTNGTIAFESGTAAIDVGADAAAHTVTIGSTTTTAATVIQSGTGDVDITSTDAIYLDSAGVLELNSSAGTIGIGTDAVAQDMNIGTGAAARTITIGNATGATAVILDSGTGGIDMSSTGTGDIVLDSDDEFYIDADGVLEVNSSGGAISIGNDADAQAINVGTGAAARTITVGNITGATGLVLNAGSGNIALTSTDSIIALNSGTGAVNIGTDAAAHTVTIGSNTGAADTYIQSGTGGIDINTYTGDLDLNTGGGNISMNSGTGTFDIGTDATAHILTLGSTNTTSQTILQSGTGDVNITSTDAVTVDAAGVLELNSSAGIIGIGNDAVAQNINIGTGAAARTITMGNITGATALALNSGTGHITLTSTGTGDIILAAGDSCTIDGTGVIEINSSGGAISIGNDADAQAVNVGTGAAARSVTVGSTNTTSDTTIQSGTGGITLSAAGNVDVVPVTNSVAGVSLTLDGRVGQATFTGQTTGAAASTTFTVTNSSVSTSNALILTLTNGGTNDAQMTVQRIEQKAGSFEVIAKNNGAAALNGDVLISFWVLN